jgi:serine/threonine protein kinase
MALRESDPSEVGGYRIEDRLGSGGMGVVYLARSDSGRRLALKVVHAQYADDDEFRTLPHSRLRSSGGTPIAVR